jgi:hypothetical protein
VKHFSRGRDITAKFFGTSINDLRLLLTLLGSFSARSARNILSSDADVQNSANRKNATMYHRPRLNFCFAVQQDGATLWESDNEK